MNESEHRLFSIFAEAIEIDDLSARKVYLAQACGRDSALQQEVEGLIQADANSGRFLPSFPATDNSRSALRGAADALRPRPDLTECPGREKPGDWIGRYRLIKKLGEGGCGTVYLAEQEVPVRRRVALKIIKLGMDTRQVVARFEVERQALALMDHPNIAKVFDAGATESGRPFFVMELVQGIRITDYVQQKRLDIGQRLELFIKVCQAVQHAHQKGVIHRDLKPSNILVAAHDAAAVPKVIDFGIAKAIEGRLTGLTMLTAFEQFLGTPAYMSPEQAALTEKDVDTRSDIYSLGVLLYELLTGATPFDTKALLAAGLDELRRTIREKEPLRPSARLITELSASGARATRANGDLPAYQAPTPETQGLAPGLAETKEIIKLVRGDLDWIVMKCLEKDRTRRYETANSLASDIQRHLKNEPVIARPPSRLYEFQKTVRRHKVGFAATAAVIVSLLAGVLLTAWQAVQKEAERRLLQKNLVHQYVDNGSQLMSEADLFRSLLWYACALNLDQGDPRREEPHRIRIASLLRQCPKLLNVLSHDSFVYDVRFSPDGSGVLTCGVDGTARVWDCNTGQQLLVLHHDAEVNDARFSPDGLRIITASSDKTARLWNSQGGLRSHILKHENVVWCACFVPGSDLVATACENNKVQFWDSRTGDAYGAPFVWDRRICRMEFSLDGRILATQNDEQVCLWDVATGQKRLQTSHSWLLGVKSFSADSQRLLTQYGAQIHVWNLRTFAEAAFSPIQTAGEVNSVAFSPDAESIVAASSGCAVGIWNVHTGLPRFAQTFAEMGEINIANLSPDGRCLATGARCEQLRFWSAQTGAALAPPIKHSSSVSFFEFNPDGHRFVANSCDRGGPRLWDLVTSDLPGPPRPTIPDERRIFSPDRKRVLAAENDTVWILDTGTGERQFSLRHTNKLLFASFLADGSSVITSCMEPHASSHHKNHIFLWDSSTGRRLNTYEMAHPFGFRYVASTRDTLLTCGADATARLWDAHNGRSLGTPMRHLHEVTWAAFNSSGTSVVTASRDKTARVWETATCQPLTPPLPHRAAVVGAFWSADGKRLHTVTADDYLQVWELATGEPLTPPRKISSLEHKPLNSDLNHRQNVDESLPLDTRPVSDLVLLAQFLDLARIDQNGKVLPLKVADLPEAWHVLRQKYPQQFATTAAEVAAWHQFQAKESRSETNLSATLFHLDRALANTPSDTRLAEQQNEIKQAMANTPALSSAANRTLGTNTPPRATGWTGPD